MKLKALFWYWTKMFLYLAYSLQTLEDSPIVSSCSSSFCTHKITINFLLILVLHITQTQIYTKLMQSKRETSMILISLLRWEMAAWSLCLPTKVGWDAIPLGCSWVSVASSLYSSPIILPFSTVLVNAWVWSMPDSSSILKNSQPH